MITPNEARSFATCLDGSHAYTIEWNAAQHIRDLAQQVEDLQADAARYREIRSSYTARKALCGQCTEAECDAIIDEAMK